MLLDHAVKSKVVPDLGLSACLLGLRTTWWLSGFPIPTGSSMRSSRRVASGGSRDLHNLSHQLREGDLGVLHCHSGCMGVFRPMVVQCRVLLFKITEHINNSNTADGY